MEDDRIDVLLIQPDDFPERIQISADLESLQSSVGGLIEVTYPFEDKVGLICNEEGKLMGMPLNRAVFTESGRMSDIIAGPFLVAGLTEDNFGSLSEDQLKRYGDMFHSPQKFLRLKNRILAIPVPDRAVEDAKQRKAVKVKQTHDIGER